MLKQYFYAVRKGRTPGIYPNWDGCKTQIVGFSGPEYKKFSTAAEAEAYMKGEPASAASRSSEGSSRGQKRNFASVSDESQWLVVYTDGACKGNGRAGSLAGVGVFWGPNDPRNLAERCPGDQTNNRAELIAIIRVLETTPMTKDKLLIKTDSQYSINCFEKWLPNWRRNGFKTTNGEPVRNAGIIIYLSALLEERGRRGQQIRLQYVKGHSGDPGNDGADAQANIGAMLPPRPEHDWDVVTSRTGETVAALIPTNVSQVPATQGAEVDVTPQPSEAIERPAKISKNSRLVSLDPPPTASPLRKTPIKPRDPVVPTMVFTPTRPARSPLRPSTAAASSPNRPTVYSRPIHQTTRIAEASPAPGPDLMMPAIAPRPQTPPRKSPSRTLQVTSISTLMASPHNSAGIQPSTPKSSRSPKSPLTVSKVAPPLIPASASDIDLDLYKDCLLEGEEWEKEIENL